MVKIFIDPGHGGIDPGATGNGLLEKNITFQIATMIRDILSAEYSNVSVKMSRTGDQTVSPADRVRAANNWKADYFLSIHINAGGGTGYEDYIYKSAGNVTKAYQKNMHEEITKLISFHNRGKKLANFEVLRETTMPAILTENGFIDHAQDSARLKSRSFLNQVARGHVNGLAKNFRLSP